MSFASTILPPALVCVLFFRPSVQRHTPNASLLHAQVFVVYMKPIWVVQVQEYFIALVDGTIEASVKYVREYVHAYLSDMLEEARGQIHSYGQSFSTTIQAALSTRQQGWSLFGSHVVSQTQVVM